uniref:Uncharacterized protein n=1 Tax=Arundo donax TaxID=35708 RepID=A0A0A8Z364_ARUDO
MWANAMKVEKNKPPCGKLKESNWLLYLLMNTKLVHKLCQACNLYLHVIWCSCHCEGVYS